MSKFLIPLILSLMICNACSEQQKVDLLITNAQIYTVDDQFNIFNSMAVKDGRIIELGNNTDLDKKYQAAKLLNANGKAMFPGFIDPHCHFYGYGLSLQQVNLTGTKSFDDVIKAVKEFSKNNTAPWIIGRGWDQNDWVNNEFPDNSELSQIFPDIPVLLFRVDGHAVLANQKAIEKSGILNLPEIKGGELVYKAGVFTGLCIDKAADFLRNKIPSPNREQIVQAFINAQENCFAVGLTSVHDAGLDADIISLIDSLQKTGHLKTRIFAMLNPGEENYKAYLYKGKYKTDRLNVSSIKLYADGALGSRGALLIEPYTDAPGKHGLEVNSPSFIKKAAALADSFSFQVCTHCIGDRANRNVLNIYSELLGGKNNKRWRIEHAQIIHPDDLHLFDDFNIIPSIQTTHATSDMYWAHERLGSRISSAYIYKDLLKQNNWLPNGSDFPVEDINPLYGFYAGSIRKDQSSFPENGFQIKNALSREEALKAMTIWAAKAGFEEIEKGSLEPGKLADFVILDHDIMKADEKDIFRSQVLYTYSGGECVYSKD